MGNSETVGGKNREVQCRFVVLKHDWPEPHRDLIVELRDPAGSDRLPTWALYPELSDDVLFPTDRSLAGRAVTLEPHRREYLDYEGPVSGDRGSVKRECRGVVIDSVKSDVDDWIQIDLVVIGSQGEFGRGELRIEKKPGNPLIGKIRVGRDHAGAADSNLVFEWRPTRVCGTSENGCVG